MPRGRATIATHSNRDLPARARPIAPPITLASVHRFADLDELLAASRGEADRWTFYRRYGNPNGRLLEETLADLEGAEDALACSSGMSAAAALLQSLTERGDRVVAARDLYGGTTAWLRGQLSRLGVQVGFRPLEEIERDVPGGTKAVVVETVSNPLCRVADLRSIAAGCRKAGAALVVDNTFATPFLCRPLEWGATAVWHSGTKFLNGHGDAVSGIVCGSADVVKRARKLAVGTGGTISPFDAWLTLRGVKTLGLRIERASANAEALVRLLSRHRKVARVHYPPSTKYLRPRRGPMFSFELKGGLAAAKRFVRACRLLELAPSLGDVTTTLSHPARSSHAYLSPAERAEAGVTDGLLRVSTGIEDPADILSDLGQALSKA
jgi:cystathionine beta-lyase/cystathionine gamma-synthase